MRDVSTETGGDFSSDSVVRRSSGRPKLRNESPGRAIAQLKMSSGTGSPPPIDPSEDLSSYTTETATATYMEEVDADMNREWSPSPSSSYPLRNLRKYRKRVTFSGIDSDAVRKPKKLGKDGKPKREVVSPDSQYNVSGLDTDFSQSVIDLTTENDQLRKIIADMENMMKGKIEEQIRIDQVF